MVFSALGTSSWALSHKQTNALFAAVVLALSIAKAAGLVARHALAQLLAITLPTLYANSCDHGTNGGRDDKFERRRRTRASKRVGALVAVATGASRVVGVLIAGAVFSRAVQAGIGAGVACFRLSAVGFLGLYLASMFVDATIGTGGGGGENGRRGAAGAGGGDSAVGFVMCDFFYDCGNAGGGYHDVGVGGKRHQGGEWTEGVMGKES